jgi:hypothetical protein
MALEVVARLAVLLACAVAAGALLVMVAGPTRRARLPHDEEPFEPRPLAGLVPAGLAAFILLAGGTALSGAATVQGGDASVALAAIGIGILAAAGLLAARAARRGPPSATTAPAATASPTPPSTVAPPLTILVLLWAGAALALSSWLIAAGAVLLALLGSLRVDRRVP